MSDPNQTFEHIEEKPNREATGAYIPLESATALVGVLDQYLADLQAGKAPDKVQLLAQHPELALQLEQCLSGIEFVHKAAKPQAGVPARLGDFQIIREVGRGGMGVVYEAEQISLKRKVALKVLRFGATADPEVMKRFQREAETVAHLHHTNIVPIHAVGCEQGVNYYAMQFIEGKSLAELPKLGGKTDKNFREIAGWALQAAEALAHAHQRGVIHRDIKPSNLILDPEGTVWLTDFGLAKRADEVTMTAAGVLMGTPRYMSPEQAASAKQPIDHRTDIYSLGATLYELTTDKPVFDAQTPQGVITQILNTEPVSPRLIQGRMPRDLETIILKCLAKEPDKRYQQARDLADDLRSYLENRAIKARRPSLAERALRWAKKKKGSAIVAGVAAAAAIVLMIGGYFAYDTYRSAQLSHLSLTTDGSALVAEVLDDKDELVLPSFPVPTPQPVTMPAGAYRLRLSGSGQLSETWDITLERGTTQQFPVKLLDRFLGPPLEVRGPDAPMLIELNGQMHIFHRSERGWRLVNGATLAPVWPNDLKYPFKLEDAPYPNSGYRHDLMQVSSWNQSEATGGSPGLVKPAVDVDGDGKDDLIFALRLSPLLLAVSGKETGKILWQYRALPNFPKEHDAGKDPFDLKNSNEDAGVIGQPIVVNIDGEPTVIAMFAALTSNLRTKSGKTFSIARTFYMEAVAARTGKQLWRTIVNLPEFATTQMGEVNKLFPLKPEIVQLNGKSTILLAINTKLFGFDLKTGIDTFPVFDLGVRPIQAPQFADFDGDGQPEALFLHRKDDSNEKLMLRVVALKTRATVWERSFLCPVNVDRNAWRTHGAELAWVADLNADGKAQIIIPVKDDWSEWANHWFGLEALDGATGHLRWQRRLRSAGNFSGMGNGIRSIRVLLGPDLNGDGNPELFVASGPSDLGFTGNNDSTYLHVDALSSKDGSGLWKSRHKVSSEYNPFNFPGRLQWWQPGADGWPQLVIPVDKGLGGQPSTFILAASTGKTTHLLPEIGDPQVADIDSDGLSDLYHLASSQGTRRMIVFKGLPPLEWRRPGNLRPGADYNGDGIIDFLEVHAGLDARSGRDGRLLWHANFNNYYETPALLLSVDVDGDGIADVVTMEYFTGANGNHITIAAFSGKDGQRIWRGPDFGTNMGSSSSSGGGPRTEYRYPMLDLLDLDGDGRPEILIAASFGNAGLCLIALSSKDGSMLWKIPIVEGAYTGCSLIDRQIFHDLNGDGVLDLILWVRDKDKTGNPYGAVLRAFNGRDGSPLWPETPDRFTNDWFLWPRPAIADLDGDGIPDVVVTTSDGKGYSPDKKGYPCELVVLDGRTGMPKWRWPWVSSSQVVWPPLLVNAEGDGKRVICMGVQDGGWAKMKIIVFDAKGTIRQTILRDISVSQGERAWAALDLVGDGKEALLYRGETMLIAYDLSEQKDLWTWAFAGWGVRFEKPLLGRKGQPGSLVIRDNQTLYILDNKTGGTRWRCEVPKLDNIQIETELVNTPSPETPPLLVSHFSGQPNAIAQRFLRTQANGRYQPVQPGPLTFSGLDQTEYRPLPWALFRSGPAGMGIGLGKLISFVGFVCTLVFWGIRGRWRQLCVFLVLAVILTSGVAVWLVHADLVNAEPNERYSWAGWYWIVFFGGCIGFIPIFLWMIVTGAIGVGRKIIGSGIRKGL